MLYRREVRSRLNPFENQVYFYRRAGEHHRLHWLRLNPFENQVYFYVAEAAENGWPDGDVLIPLRIRSISTLKFLRPIW